MMLDIKRVDTQSVNPVIQNILSRRSIRKFTEEPIPRPILETILMAGYHAPSGRNLQTWKFTVLVSASKIQELKNAIQEVAQEQDIKQFYGFENPTTLILISNDRRNENGIQDSACAAENMMLAATSYGLGSVWLNHLKTICDEPQIRSFLNDCEIPKNHNVWAMVALGYPAEEGKKLGKKNAVVRWIE